jgi:hypothetical protein
MWKESQQQSLLRRRRGTGVELVMGAERKAGEGVWGGWAGGRLTAGYHASRACSKS